MMSKNFLWSIVRQSIWMNGYNSKHEINITPNYSILILNKMFLILGNKKWRGCPNFPGKSVLLLTWLMNADQKTDVADQSGQPLLTWKVAGTFV